MNRDETTPATERRPRAPESGRGALVVGGGLAGTAAALRLADAGVPVTLVESRPRLGGLAFSFTRNSPAGALTVDNGQHVHLRCFSAYRWLLGRLRADGLAPVQRRLDIPVLDAAGPRPRLGRLRRNALPAPLHLAASLARYPHLSPAERVSVGRVALALRRIDPGRCGLDGEDFAGWLGRHGQSARAAEALWDLIGTAALNSRAPHASSALAAMVFKTALLSDRGAADIGRSRVPLGTIHDTLTQAALHRAGVRTLLNSRVRKIVPQERGWRVTVEHGRSAGETAERADWDTVLLAVDQREAYGLLPQGALSAPERLLDIGASPILNVHVVYDRRVLRRPFFAALGTPVQWVFDRTGPSGLGGGQYLALSQSAADREIDEPVATLRARYLPELERLLPAARGAAVRDFFVTRERTATFAPAPGVEALRPGARTGVPGVFLAGAWTDTGWPATMEGAVRSGVTAAREALAALGRPCDGDPMPGTVGRAVA